MPITMQIIETITVEAPDRFFILPLNIIYIPTITTVMVSNV